MHEDEQRAYERGKIEALCNLRDPSNPPYKNPYREPRLMRAWDEGVRDFRRELDHDSKFAQEAEERRAKFVSDIQRWLVGTAQ